MPRIATDEKNIKFRFLVLGLLFFIFNFVSASNVADRIAATVGDEIILESELHEGIEFIKMMNQSSASDSELKLEVLDEMIKNRLILDQAKRETVDVSRSEIDDEVEKNIQALRQKFNDEQEFQNALVKEGINERILRERYRTDIRKRLISQKLMMKKGLTTINITPTEIKKFYDANKDSVARQPGQVTLAHILFIIKPSTQAEEAGQKKISEIYDIIQRGGDFEEVAKSFSEDQLTKDRGGYLGKIKTDLLQPEVQAVVSNMKTGEVSQPFRSRNGYEIIKIISSKGENIELSHITVKVQISRDDTLQTKKTAQKIRTNLFKGSDFDSIVKIYSDDPMTRDSSGNLGQFYIAGLQEPFRSAVRSLSEGEVSELVLSEHGYHLLKVVQKQEERILDLAEIQDEIRNYLYEDQLKERLENYIEKIAKVTYIEKFIE
jgi:peptidyl-prolyl cis-trans isomerase SurA